MSPERFARITDMLYQKKRGSKFTIHKKDETPCTESHAGRCGDWRLDTPLATRLHCGGLIFK